MVRSRQLVRPYQRVMYFSERKMRSVIDSIIDPKIDPKNILTW